MHENGIKANHHLTFEFCFIKNSSATLNFKWLALKKEAPKIYVRKMIFRTYLRSAELNDISQASKKHQLLWFSSYLIYLMNKQTDSNFSIFDLLKFCLFILKVSYHNFFWKLICFTFLDVLDWINAKKTFLFSTQFLNSNLTLTFLHDYSLYISYNF